MVIKLHRPFHRPFTALFPPPNAPKKQKTVQKSSNRNQTIAKYVEINCQKCVDLKDGRSFDAQIVEFYSVYSDNIGQFVTNMQENDEIFTGGKY